MSFIARIKDIWKATLKSGKIVERRLKVKQRKFDSFSIFLMLTQVTTHRRDGTRLSRKKNHIVCHLHLEL